MKQLIRITEEDLNNIISESVKNILSELDWRTYNNAAMKDYDKKRAQKFANARDKKFNDEFEYSDHKNGNFVRMQGDFNNPRIEVLSKNDSKDKKHWIKYPEDKRYSFYTNYTSGYEDFPNTDSDKKFARNLAKAHDAINSINNKYENGRYVNNEKPTDFHKFLGKK